MAIQHDFISNSGRRGQHARGGRFGSPRGVESGQCGFVRRPGLEAIRRDRSGSVLSRNSSEDLKRTDCDGWFYCGAIENFPSIVEQIQKTCPNCGPLLGTPPTTLRLVRDPWWLADVLSSRGFPHLDIHSEDAPPPPDGDWLRKPIASAGGRSIEVWNEKSAKRSLDEPHYFQRRIEGRGVSAAIHVSANTVDWLGMTEEIRNTHSDPAPTDFTYRGSFGPIVDIALQCQISQIAQTIIEQAPGLRGIVGFDFRFDGETAWLTEVNPRYTASIELLELAYGRSALTSMQNSSPPKKLIAKRILYASTSLVAPDLSAFLHQGSVWEVPAFADIPVPGTPIEVGWPICTVFATEASEDALWSQLNERGRAVLDALERGVRKTY